MGSARDDWQRIKRERRRQQAQARAEQRRLEEQQAAADRRQHAQEEADRARAEARLRRQQDQERQRSQQVRGHRYRKAAEQAFAPTPVAGHRERRMARRYADWAQSQAYSEAATSGSGISFDVWLAETQRRERNARKPLQALAYWFLQMPLIYGVVWGLFAVALLMGQGDGIVFLLGVLGVLVLGLPAALLLLALPIMPFLPFTREFYDADGIAMFKDRPLPSEKVLADRAEYAQWTEQTRQHRADNDRRLADLGIDA